MKITLDDEGRPVLDLVQLVTGLMAISAESRKMRDEVTTVEGKTYFLGVTDTLIVIMEGLNVSIRETPEVMAALVKARAEHQASQTTDQKPDDPKMGMYL